MGTSSPILAREIDLWVYHTHVSSQGIVATESLLLHTQCATDFLLSHVVYGVLVPGEVIWPRENCIAGFPCCRIDALTLVRASLRVACRECS
jgi:hypothetical protein